MTLAIKTAHRDQGRRNIREGGRREQGGAIYRTQVE